MPPVKRLGLYICLILTVLLGGCIDLGPEYRPPELPFQIGPEYQHAPEVTKDWSPADCWWRVFGDPELDRVVDEVVRNNLDLKKAATRILELKAGVIRAGADRWPAVNLQFQRQKEGHTVKPLIPRSESRYLETDSQSLSFPVSYEIDLWSRLAKTEQAAWADLLQAEENRRALLQSLVAEAVSLYLEMESQERRLEITRKTIDSYSRNLEMIQRRYDHGLANVLTLHQARRSLAQAEASLPVIKQDLGLTQQKLAVLLGRYPRTSPPRRQPREYYQHLDAVPPGLPSDLLRRRPDIRAAEAALLAANERVGAALAARFPRISLTGNYGYASDDLYQLFGIESALWNLALGLTQPIFNAGRLRSMQRQAEARYLQLQADYAQTILQALAEVEGALLRRQEQLARREHLKAFLDEARATLEAARSRYERGLSDYLNLLEAQQARYRAEENLILSDLAILTNRVQLYRALGGAWPAAFDRNAEGLPGSERKSESQGL